MSWTETPEADISQELPNISSLLQNELVGQFFACTKVSSDSVYLYPCTGVVHHINMNMFHYCLTTRNDFFLPLEYYLKTVEWFKCGLKG